MSININYNPQPPRVWTRVQGNCSTNQSNIANDIVYIPLTNQYATPLEAQFQEQMLQKGNILQYKNNSASLTKNQKYSQLSKGLGNSRKKNYATQSQVYTNPNTSSLSRINYTTIYPNDIVNAPNNPSGPYQTNVPNPFNCPTNGLQDGGNLLCNTIVNPCSEAVIETFSHTNPLCYSTSFSNVPGKPINLCWYTNVQSWYPKKRYQMSNSLNKWPEGYKGFVSAVTPVPPVLSISPSLPGTASLSWTTNTSNCLPISSYNLYQNGILINVFPYQINSTTVYGLTIGETYTFYVVSVSQNISSQPSNTVSNV